MATPPIQDVDVRNDYTASGGQTTFTYTFWAKEEDWIDVYVNNVLQTLTTDYTISGVQNANGGDIVFTSGLTNGDAVAIVYDPDIERQTDFETAGSFTADAVDLEYDTLVSYVQYLNTIAGRTLRVADDESTTAALTVEAPDSNANKFIKVNSGGTGYDYATIASTDTLANYEKQLFSGDGVTTTFSLTAFTPIDADQIEVVVDNQTQYPVEDYTISGSDVIFEAGSTPASGTNNIFIRNLANGSLTTTPADSSVSTAKIQANAVTAAKIDSDFIVDYTDTVIATTDLIVFGDVSDTNNTKRDTVQGLIDLVPADLFGKADATIATGDKISFSDVSDSDNPKTDTVQGILDLVPSTMVEGTEQATTSGTAFDFTSIPSDVKRITINFDSVSLSGTNDIVVQIGDSGGFETTGYDSGSSILGAGAASSTSTSGFVIYPQSASQVLSGSIVLTLMTGSQFKWTAYGCFATNSGTVVCGGVKSLSATLDRVRITRDGSNTFDNGAVNIMYES